MATIKRSQIKFGLNKLIPVEEDIFSSLPIN